MNGSHSQIRNRRPDRILPVAETTGMPQPAKKIAAAEVDERQPSQPAIDLLGNDLGLHQHEVLDGAERADAGAEHAAEEERRDQRQEEEREDADRDEVVRVDQREGHVLDRPDRARAPLAVEPEVGDGADAERDRARAAAAHQHQVGAEREARPPAWPTSTPELDSRSRLGVRGHREVVHAAEVGGRLLVLRDQGVRRQGDQQQDRDPRRPRPAASAAAR